MTEVDPWKTTIALPKQMDAEDPGADEKGRVLARETELLEEVRGRVQRLEQACYEAQLEVFADPTSRPLKERLVRLQRRLADVRHHEWKLCTTTIGVGKYALV